MLKGNITTEPILTTISKTNVAITAIVIASNTVAFFLKKPPKNPAAPKPIAWNIVHGPCPPKTKKLDRYKLEAPVTAPFFLPNSHPANKAKKVKGSTLGKTCIGTLNKAAPLMKPINIKYSFNFNSCSCFCIKARASFCLTSCPLFFCCIVLTVIILDIICTRKILILFILFV